MGVIWATSRCRRMDRRQRLARPLARRGQAGLCRHRRQGSGSEFHLSYTFADTFLGGRSDPARTLDERRANVFTSPQSFDNRMQMVNLTGSVSVTDHLKVSGNAYYRGFKQKRPDGNVSEAIACDPAGPNAGAPLLRGAGRRAVRPPCQRAPSSTCRSPACPMVIKPFSAATTG